MKYFMSPLEIADAAKRLGVSGFPKSKGGVNRRARNECWGADPRWAKRRLGRALGGGMEYHISLLPNHFIVALKSEQHHSIIMRLIVWMNNLFGGHK